MVRQDELLAKAVFEHNPNGHIIIDGKEVGHTLQCAHCNKHWVSVKGSGTIRGFCTLCNKRTCGAKSCDVCIPYERKMEKEEKRWKETRMQREDHIAKLIKKLEMQGGVIIGGMA